MSTSLGHQQLMNGVYRRQRHIYDITRRFFLLGRDPMIAGLAVPQGGSVLEIGCGTGRNLIEIHRRYPHACLYGIDISHEMLTTTGAAIARRGLQRKTRLALADAALFDPSRTFGQNDFDRIVISYSVSMIPAWETVVRQAAAHLAPGGELHIVDFGDQRGLPGWFRAALYRWLGAFHVTPRASLFHVSAEVARAIGGEAKATRLYRGFAWIAVIRR
ncbi:MAG: methyltransferase domain protein [Rhizobiaceae bacterium]|jgi:S-adenosylmethionine-diacylgycerolhomoserine-N-methlytransferase|nr:methyltransferase domain protein [Rhizobiaceae bacterium]